MAESIGTLEVDVQAKTAQAQAAISNFFNGAQKSMQSIGQGFSQAGKLMSAAVTVPLLAIGTAAVAAAMDVGKGLRIIQQRTGETGETLKGLNQSFKNLFASMPESSEVIATALSKVHAVLDLTGPKLENVTKLMLGLARVTGEDATGMVDALTHAFNQWSIPADQMEGKLNTLYTIFTDTQVPVTELASELANYGPMLQTTGIGFDTAAGMLASMMEKGEQTTPIMTGLRKVIKEAGEEGKPAAQKLREVFDAIKNAPDDTTAAKIAIEDFGARAGPILAANIRQGTLSIDGLKKSVDHLDLKDAINNTMTFGQKWTVVKHNLELALEPLGKALMNISIQFIPIITKVLAFVAKIGEAFGKLPVPVQAIIIAIGGIAAAIGPVLIVIGSIIGALAPILGILGGVLSFLLPILMGATSIGAAVAGITVGGMTLGTIFATLSPIIAGLLPIFAAIAIVVGTIVGIVTAIVAGFALWYVASSQLRGIVGGAIAYIKNEFGKLAGVIGEVIGKLRSGDWQGAFDSIKTYIQGVIDRLKNINWAEVWERLKQSLREAIHNIGDVVGNIRDELAAWADKVDWKDVGRKIGDFIGKAIVAFFKGATTILKDILNAISGQGGGNEAGNKIGQNLGTGISDYFKGGQFKIDLSNAFTIAKDVGGELLLNMRGAMSKIEVDWGLMLMQFIALAAAAGIAVGEYLVNAIVASWDTAMDLLPLGMGKPFKLNWTPFPDPLSTFRNIASNIEQNFPISIRVLYAAWYEAYTTISSGIDSLSDRYVEIRPKLNANLQGQVDGYFEQLKTIEANINANMNTEQATKQLDAYISTLDSISATVPVNADTAKFHTSLGTLRNIAEAERLMINVDANTTEGKAKLAAMEETLKTQYLVNVAMGVDNGPLLETINKIRELQGLPPITIKADGTLAVGEVNNVKNAGKDGVTMPIKGDATAANQTITDLKNCPNCQVKFAIDADASKAEGKKMQFAASVNSTTGVVSIDASDAGARSKLTSLGFEIDSKTGTVSINGNPATAQQVLTALSGTIDSTSGTVKIAADTSYAIQMLEALRGDLGILNATQVNIHVGADVGGAISALNSVLQLAHEVMSVMPAVAAGKQFVVDTHAFVEKEAQIIRARGVELFAWAQQTAMTITQGFNQLTTWAQGQAATVVAMAQNASNVTQGHLNNARNAASAAAAWANAAQGHSNFATSAFHTAMNAANAAAAWASAAQGHANFATNAFYTAMGASNAAYSWAAAAQGYANSAVNAFYTAMGAANAAYAWATAAWSYAASAQNAANAAAAAKAGAGAQEGGLVTQPTRLWVGEAGPELIVPLDKLKGGNRVLGLVPALGGNGGGGVNIYVTGNTILDDRAASALAAKIRDAIKHERGVIS